MQADDIELYNFSYAPYSTVVHGSWNTLIKFNLKTCKNPLHRFHRTPYFEDPPKHPEPVDMAMRIMDDSFKIWAKFITGNDIQSKARENMWKKIGLIDNSHV